MATFIGFNTVNQHKKFILTDVKLIQRDLLNFLNIRQGELVGRPDVGTNMWNLVFDPQTQNTAELAKEEMKRIISLDPRIHLVPGSLECEPQLNGILIELEIQAVLGQVTEFLRVFFDQQTRTASLI